MNDTERLKLAAELRGQAALCLMLSTALEAGSLAEPLAPLDVGLELIVRNVANLCNVPIRILLSRWRGEHVSHARMLAIYLSRELTDLSFPQIGAFFGRDHSTCMYAHRVIASEMVRRPFFAVTVQALRAQINAEENNDGRRQIAA